MSLDTSRGGSCGIGAATGSVSTLTKIGEMAKAEVGGGAAIGFVSSTLMKIGETAKAGVGGGEAAVGSMSTLMKTGETAKAGVGGGRAAKTGVGGGDGAEATAGTHWRHLAWSSFFFRRLCLRW